MATNNLCYHADRIQTRPSPITVLGDSVAIEFTKLQGCGNDYIAIDGRSLDRDFHQLCVEMSRPAFGVGSDGIVLALESNVADIRMRVINPDGSEAEMSGNGIRLFTKFVIDNRYASSTDGVLTVETLGGVREVYPRIENDKVSGARVSMGVATFDAAEVPVDTSEIGIVNEVIAHPVKFGDQALEITCLAIGNPHAVAVIDNSADDFPLVEIGSIVESHSMFPQRINFEVVNIIDRNSIRARVFERGAGETLSSGTGSTASATAARKLGLVGDEVDVHLDGGKLHISFDDDDSAYLDGPAVEVFRGTWLESGDS